LSCAKGIAAVMRETLNHHQAYQSSLRQGQTTAFSHLQFAFLLLPTPASCNKITYLLSSMSCYSTLSLSLSLSLSRGRSPSCARHIADLPSCLSKISPFLTYYPLRPTTSHFFEPNKASRTGVLTRWRSKKCTCKLCLCVVALSPLFALASSC
jgi:hypothetical protein